MNDKLSYDQWLTALCIYREARGESQAGRAAVFAVIKNRAEDDKFRWPRTWAAVVVQPKQFSSFNANDPNAVNWPLPFKQSDWEAFRDCCDVVLNPLQADNTNGANHYCVSTLTPKPSWATEDKKVCEIGRHSFYRL